MTRPHHPGQFGRIHRIDARDVKLPRRRTGRTRTRIWRCGPVTDQAASPSCVGHAWVGLLSASPQRTKGWDPEGLYQLAKFQDAYRGEKYDGTTVRAGAKVLRLAGQLVRYGFATSIIPLVDHVLTIGPVVMGTDWYADMNEPDRTGLVAITGALEGGHAWLCYGIDTAHQLAYGRNSWGREWGTRGNFRIRLADLAELVRRDGEACAPVER